MEDREIRLLKLQDHAGGVPSGLVTHLLPGRIDVTSAGFDPNLQLLGSDPWNSPTYTGLIVPATPTLSAQTRYLFQLARVSFNTPEKAWLTGIRLYASLFGYDEAGKGPYELPITSPMWRFALGGGNISWHVMVVSKTWRDRRNPANSDSVIYLDTPGPSALLYQSLTPTYVPPNGGRPWGKPIHSSLANLHGMPYPWADDHAEEALRIPIPSPCDIAIFASVWQHNASGSIISPVAAPSFSANQFAAAGPEDRFWSAFAPVQYGRIAASLIVSEEMGKDPR